MTHNLVLLNLGVIIIDPGKVKANSGRLHDLVRSICVEYGDDVLGGVFCR